MTGSKQKRSGTLQDFIKPKRVRDVDEDDNNGNDTTTGQVVKKTKTNSSTTSTASSSGSFSSSSTEEDVQELVKYLEKPYNENNNNTDSEEEISSSSSSSLTWRQALDKHISRPSFKRLAKFVATERYVACMCTCSCLLRGYDIQRHTNVRNKKVVSWHKRTHSRSSLFVVVCCSFTYFCLLLAFCGLRKTTVIQNINTSSSKYVIYPPPKDTFNALHYTPLSKVKVMIVDKIRIMV